MDERVKRALENDRTIDITTTGRNSGEPRRIEIWFYRYDGRIFLSGSPGTRDWYANLLRKPEFTFHLKGSVQADLPAVARPITEEAERREVITGILEELGRGYGRVEDWVAGARWRRSSSASPLACPPVSSERGRRTLLPLALVTAGLAVTAAGCGEKSEPAIHPPTTAATTTAPPATTTAPATTTPTTQAPTAPVPKTTP